MITDENKNVYCACSDCHDITIDKLRTLVERPSEPFDYNSFYECKKRRCTNIDKLLNEKKLTHSNTSRHVFYVFAAWYSPFLYVLVPRARVPDKKKKPQWPKKMWSLAERKCPVSEWQKLGFASVPCIFIISGVVREIPKDSRIYLSNPQDSSLYL